MAFADALRPTDGATVTLNVDTSQTAKLEQAEAQWRESVGTMSREALKLDLAQDRLKKSLSQYGAESAQAKRATIALKDAEEQAARAADKQTREMEQLNRTARSTSSTFSSMRNRVLGLAAAYVGVYGLAAGIRSSLNAAKEEQLVLGQTRIAVEAAGLQYERYAAQIATVIRAQSQLGFDDEALMQTFQMFVRSTKDVNRALELNALAIDVARGRYIDLEAASQIVNKANLGMSGALRRIGLDVEKNADRTQLLATLQRNYGRAAEEASNTAVAASDRLAVEWENLQEILGQGLLPAVTDLSNRISDYLGDAENQRRVQEQVNRIVEDGEDVVRGLVGALRTMREILGPVIDALGGAENAAKLFFLAFGAAKFAPVIRGVVALRVALLSLGPAAVRSSATSVAAMNTIGTAAAVNAGKVGILQRALAGLFGVPGALAVTIASVPGASGAKEGDRRNIRAKLLAGEYAKKYPRTTKVVKKLVEQGQDALTPTERYAARIAWDATSEADLARAEQVLANQGSQVSPDSADTRGRPVPASQTKTPPKPPPAGSTARTEEDIQLDIARATSTIDTGDDLRALRELRTFYARQIKALEARDKLSAEQKRELSQLYGQLSSTQSQIDAIVADGEAKLDAQRTASAEKRDREAAARAARQEREDLARARRYAQRFGKASGFGGGLAEALIQQAQKASRSRTTSATSSTSADSTGGLGFDFVAEFLRLQSEFGPNFLPRGSFTYPTLGEGEASRPAANPATVVNVNQSFPSAPQDYFREARYAQFATQAVFHG